MQKFFGRKVNDQTSKFPVFESNIIEELKFPILCIKYNKNLS